VPDTYTTQINKTIQNTPPSSPYLSHTPHTHTKPNQTKPNVKHSSETCFLQKGSRNLPGWYVVVRGSVLRGFGDGAGGYAAENGAGWFGLVLVCWGWGGGGGG
jgi:hypothetical protein